jgi:hypothetical protein
LLRPFFFFYFLEHASGKIRQGSSGRQITFPEKRSNCRAIKNDCNFNALQGDNNGRGAI